MVYEFITSNSTFFESFVWIIVGGTIGGQKKVV